MMKVKIALLLFVFCSLVGSLFGQVGGSQETVRVAILEVVDKENKINYGVEFLIRSKMTAAVSAISGYEGVDRVDVSSVLGEHDFQRTGLVSTEEIKELGRMAAAEYILVAECAELTADVLAIAAKIINVKTAGIKDAAVVDNVTVNEIGKACNELAGKLFGGGSSGASYGNIGGNNMGYGRQPSGSNYTETVFGINMQMVYVEGGDFMMGCTSEQGSDCENNEKNTRRVSLKGYYIGMTEVTQGQWKAVMGTNPSYFDGDDYPVRKVSWEDAMAFCKELSRQSGKKYTLPTEAQWEYAARGGNKNDGTKYSGSYSIDAVAWYHGNSATTTIRTIDIRTITTTIFTTHIVGSKRPNGLGLYDMSGNVWEWCRDWYASSYIGYQTNDPVGPSSGSNRVLRGGSCVSDARNCRVSSRGSDRDNYLGFRVVCEP